MEVTSQNVEKIVLPYSEKCFKWSIVAIITAMFPLFVFPMIFGLITLSYFKKAKQIWQIDKKKYTQHSMVKMWVALYLLIGALLCAGIYLTMSPFWILDIFKPI